MFGSPAGLAAIGAAGFDSFPETFGVVAADAALAVGFAAGGLAANIALGAALCALDVAGGFAGAMGAVDLLFATEAPAALTAGFTLAEEFAGFVAFAGAIVALTSGFAALAEAVAGLIAGFAALAKVVVDLAIGFATLAGAAGFTVGFAAFVCVAGCFAAALVAGFVSVA